MPAVNDQASIAAAQTAGWKLLQRTTNRGEFVTELVKTVTGAGQSGHEQRAVGSSLASQAAADTNALAALNAQRKHRYGGSPGRASGDGDSPDSRGATHSIDAT
jgi:hypothetical protein